MAYSRYTGRGQFINNDAGYKETLFSERDIKQIMQYDTARFYYPSPAELANMPTETFVWVATSKLYKVANDVYGSPHLWWLIAWFNKKPTEAHFKVGDVYQVPSDPNQTLEFFARQNT